MPAPAWIVLAVGTTAGVAALVATPLIPVARLRLRLRPRLRFPPGIGVRVRSLAAAGVATGMSGVRPARHRMEMTSTIQAGGPDPSPSLTAPHAEPEVRR